MTLDPRAIAVQGVGMTPRLLAVQGLWPSARAAQELDRGSYHAPRVRFPRRKRRPDDDEVLLLVILR